jgi:hypothetical protein
VSTRLAASAIDVELPLKPMPSLAELERQWQQCGDRVEKERLWRRRQVRGVVGDGAVTSMPLWAWRIGDAILVGQPNEAYSRFQIALRDSFPQHTLAVINLVNGSAGYLAPSDLYPGNAYQIQQSPFAAGAFEQLLSAAQAALQQLSIEGVNHVCTDSA